MQLRVTLNRGDSFHNVLITADATATATDVATAILSEGLSEPLETSGPRPTLQVQDPLGHVAVLSPDAAVAESGVHSGSMIRVVPEPENHAGSETVGAVLRVLDGPDTGLEVPLRIGASRIGRSPSADVRLSDPKVSKLHARVLVGTTIDIIDDNSANGVLVGNQRINRATLGAGDIAVLGKTQLRIDAMAGARGGASVEVAYMRPPRVLSRPVAMELELPDVPEPPTRARFPLLALIAPLVMGVSMYFFTQSPMTLLFVAMSPILMMGTYFATRVENKRKQKTDLANFHEGMKLAENDMAEAQELELRQLRRLYPSTAECVDAAMNRNGALWCRQPEHPEFLQVRLGIGSVRALHQFKASQRRGLVALQRQQTQLREKYRLIHEAPIVADLRSVGGLGIAGSSANLIEIARGLIFQVAALHSPAEVVLTCLTSTDNKPHWSWLEWLPHTSSSHRPIEGPCLAGDGPSGRALLDQLEDLIDLRAEGDEPALRGPLKSGENTPAPVVPAVIVLVHEAAVDLARVAHLAERGPDVGVYVVWVAGDRHQFPAACRTFVELQSNGEALIGMVRSERVFASVSTEAVDLETAHALARTMSPLVDASSPVEDESDLPRMVSVVGLLGSSVDDPEQVLSRWQDNGSYVNRSAPAVPRERAGDLRAIVGHAGLEPFTIDLRSQGPHALVGGTTGAGKSEFLQAWVLGMAHAHSPDRVTFLFVDYKGGAAFAKCVELPHCVGIVTDLSSYLVRRALRSLRAEIRYREHLFNAKGVKDLIEFEKRGDPECPPSLIIIVDEFAALVGEVPEFIDGVVDVAQRGRSLGLHLVLATQRPAGVIKDNLRANTNLRVALRMNDEHDSTDVLGSPVAASIDPANPGRGVAKMGPGRLIPFQSAFPGARTPAEPPAPPIDVDELDFGMVTRWKIPRASASGNQVEKDIERVVRTVSQASMLGRIPTPRRPWLDTLSESYDLLTLKQQRDSTLMLGVVDDPDNQSQYPDAFHPDETGNIVYYGAGGSGKTTALRSLAIAASITPRSGPVHIYGLDFAGGGLNMLEPLPNVGAIISGDDDERVSRLMEMLTKKLDERAAAFNAVAADVLSKYRQQPGKQDEPRILILLDGFQSFRTEYDSGLQRAKTYSQFHRLLAEGRAVGIHVAVTADRGAAIPSAMQGSFQERIVLRMSDTDQYLTLNVPKDVLNNASPPGRCMNSRNGNEMQLAVLGSDPSPPAQAREIELLAQSIAQFQRTRPEPVRRLPAQVLADELPVTVGGLPTLGLEDQSLGPIGFEPQGVYLLAGPPKSGVSSLVRWLAQSMANAHPQVPRILLTARPSPLAKLPLWTAAITGPDRVQDYINNQLKPYLTTEAEPGKPRVAVFVEQFSELAGSLADATLAEALKLARRNGHLMAGAGETASFSGFNSSIPELKGARQGMLLQPETTDGDILKAALPRSRAADFPPGRGFWVSAGNVVKVQVPAFD